MVRIPVIPFDFVKHCDMSVGCTSGNENDHLKYQAIYVGLAWEADFSQKFNFGIEKGKEVLRMTT